MFTALQALSVYEDSIYNGSRLRCATNIILDDYTQEFICALLLQDRSSRQ